jgi:hypothetical protein
MTERKARASATADPYGITNKKENCGSKVFRR